MFKNENERTESTKGERTRELIRGHALASFRERGYDDTTLRLIAAEAGVSLGNAYYYFPTKNHLVQELYLEVTESFGRAAAQELRGVTSLVDRIGAAYRAGLAGLEPYHSFAPGFLSAAVSPRSPINPLGHDSEPAYRGTLAVFQEVVAGADHTLPDDLAEMLPDALMLAYLLLALFWVYDASPGRERTHRLLERGLGLFGLALPLLRLPFVRKPVRELLRLVAEVRA